MDLTHRGGIHFYGKFQDVPPNDIYTLSFRQKTISSFFIDNHQVAGFGLSVGGDAAIQELTVKWCPNRTPFIGVGDDSTEIARIVFHLFNFIDFFGMARSQDDKCVTEHIKLDYQGWEINISSLPATKDDITILKTEGGFRITHVGNLQRTDRTPFSGKDAASYLNGLGLFLSFVKGCWCQPICAVGYNPSDDIVWQSWSSPEPWQAPPSWFDPHNSSQMALLFPGFMSRWADSDWNKALHEVIYWYLIANHDFQRVDAGIILGQTAIERLSYEISVNDKKLLSKNGFNKLWASDKFRLLFSSLRIPVDIPSESVEFRKLSSKMKWIDAAHALSEIRNSLVHPERKIDQMSSTLYFEAWNLCLWYVEMSILALCGYMGTYGNRLKQTRWIGQVEDVPWKK